MSKPNSSRSKPLSEAHIQRTCTDWLALDGWRCVRTDMPHLRGLGVSEPGMADNLYIRYDCTASELAAIKNRFGETFNNLLSSASVMWIEWKRIKVRVPTKAKQNQQEWHEAERARGALTLISGEDFPASIEGFCIWYAASGLQRKSISIPK